LGQWVYAAPALANSTSSSTSSSGSSSGSNTDAGSLFLRPALCALQRLPHRPDTTFFTFQKLRFQITVAYVARLVGTVRNGLPPPRHPTELCPPTGTMASGCSASKPPHA
jgi:hypothetical protein